MSTTTTEISSNSNSSCRLLDCLNSLPFHDQRVFRSLLGHTDFLRLSACCRSLRSSIRNDRTLWQERYHRDFLSGAYYVKEMDFVLWCIRTDVNNPCTSDKRSDLLENVDWYNTYRRRVSTENNWRYGRCNTTYIDMGTNKDRTDYRVHSKNDRIYIMRRIRFKKSLKHRYNLEYLPHSNLKASSNIVYNTTFTTSPNVLPLNSGNEVNYFYVLGDHYIAASPTVIKSDTNYNVKIFTRKQGGIFTTFDIPVRYKVKAVEGKWVSLVRESSHSTNIMVYDIDNNAMCLGNTDGIWNTTRFYKTTNNTAILYTARLVKDDDTGRIEWALHQFSSNNPVVQLRNGWFQLPKEIENLWPVAYNSYDSHMIIKLDCFIKNDPYILHSVASSGQSHTPRNCYVVSDEHMPIPLLRAGCRYSMFDFRTKEVWTDLTYNGNQVLQIPDTEYVRHIIGNLYVFFTIDYNNIGRRLLVDTSTKEIIRELEMPTKCWEWNDYAMVGMPCSPYGKNMPILHEYGEL